MPAAANIVIADRVPANHTFAYAPLPNNVAGWEDRAGGIMVGYNQITMSINRPKPNTGSATVGNRYHNVVVRLRTPKLETLGTADNGFTPPPTVAFTPMVEVRFALPERCTLADRQDLLAYAKNLLANAFVTAAVENLEPAY